MSSSNRKGDWLQSFTGRHVWPLDMRPEDIDLRDIARSLSLQCRFGGACLWFYCVAEHCVRASYLVESWGGNPIEVLAANDHDASEYACVDVPRPFKRNLSGYAEIEAGVVVAVEAWAGLPHGACSLPIVKRADEVMLTTEKRDHMAPPPAAWGLAQGIAHEPLRWRINAWTFVGFFGWATASIVGTAREFACRGPAAAVVRAWDALREFAHSGPWPSWYAERRFIARHGELTNRGWRKSDEAEYMSNR